MSRKKTVEELKEQIWENSLHTCEYISGEAKAGSKIHVRCVIHNIEFDVSYDTIRKATRKHHICPECKTEDNHKDMILLTCDYCGKQYLKPKGKANLYKFHFCCRTCKDKAQQLESGDKFAELRPEHYGAGYSEYRTRAFANYEHKCEICGWDEDEDVLEVHYIDEDRRNANLENLIILCPTCHKKLTTGKYVLDREHKKIIKMGL